MYYFPHDVYASQDDKMRRLKARYGMAGIGVFWEIIQTLYRQGGVLLEEDIALVEMDCIGVDNQTINSILRDFDLFVFKDGTIQNKRVNKYLKQFGNNSKQFGKQIAENTKRRGAPKGNRNACKQRICDSLAVKTNTETNQINSETNTETNQINSDPSMGDIGGKIKREKEKNKRDISSSLRSEESVGGESAKRFHPPTPDEVSDYALGQGKTIDAERFCDFYASKGWMVGRSKMKDWKAAVRNWMKRDSSNEKQLPANYTTRYERKPTTAAGRNQQNAHENEQLRLAIAERKRQRGEL